MSYEGRDVYICDNGHLTFTDINDTVVPENCSICNKKLKFAAHIDETNDLHASKYHAKKLNDKKILNKYYDKKANLLVEVTKPATYKLILHDHYVDFFTGISL